MRLSSVRNVHLDSLKDGTAFPDVGRQTCFPCDPQTAAATRHGAGGRSLESHVYSLRQDDAVFKLAVAELADTGLEESAVTSRAIEMLSDDRLQQYDFKVDAIRDAEQVSPAE
jgi:hypothetical protein